MVVFIVMPNINNNENTPNIVFAFIGISVFFCCTVQQTAESWTQTLYCSIWTSGNTSYPIVVEAIVTKIWTREWGTFAQDTYSPFLLSCRIPSRPMGDIIKISLSSYPCSTSNISWSISIPPQLSSKTDSSVAVCVKPLFFKKDISKRLVYWLEINKLLGARIFDVYVDKVHKRTLKTLKYYNATPSVVLRNYKNFELRESNPWTMRNTWTRRKHEVIAYNDCFYRNVRGVEFVLAVDVDEIVIPKRKSQKTWSQMLGAVLDRSTRDSYASFSVRNAYFLRRDFPRNSVPFLGELRRSQLSPTGESGKSFVSTANALTVFNHFAMDVLRPEVSRIYFLSANDVQMNHYKSECNVELLPQCAKYLSSRVKVFDSLINRYELEVEKNVLGVFENMSTVAVAA